MKPTLKQPLHNKLKNDMLLKTHLQLEGVLETKNIYNKILEIGINNLLKIEIDEFKLASNSLSIYPIHHLKGHLSNLIYFIENYNEDEILFLLGYLNALFTTLEHYLNSKLLDLSNFNISLEKKLNKINFNYLKMSSELYENIKFNNVDITLLGTYFIRNVEHQFWLNINNGNIFYTKDVKHLFKEIDIFDKYIVTPYLNVKTLYYYVSDEFEQAVFKDFKICNLEEDKFANILTFANNNYSDILKGMKNYLKTPLNNFKVDFVTVKKIYDATDYFILENSNGDCLKVQKNSYIKNIDMVYEILAQEEIEDCAAAILFYKDTTSKINAVLLSIVKQNKILKAIR